MKQIRIACSGFPVGQKMYRSKLHTVELAQMFDGIPMQKTLDRWKGDSSTKFEFVACVPEDVSHMQAKNRARGDHRLGIFQDTPEVQATFRRTVEAATLLGSKLLFFRVPRTFAPSADNAQKVLRFFKHANHGKLALVWEPPVSWPASIVTGLSKSLRLITAQNPLSGQPPTAPVRYFRLGAGGKTSGIHSFTDGELEKVKTACEGALSYVVFNNGPRAFDDAVRFSSLIY